VIYHLVSHHHRIKLRYRFITFFITLCASCENLCSAQLRGPVKKKPQGGLCSYLPLYLYLLVVDLASTMMSMMYLAFLVDITAHPPRGLLSQSTTPPCASTVSGCLATASPWPISTAAYRICGQAETALRQGQWEKCRAVSRVLENGRRSRRRRRLKSATSATAVCCPDENCLTVLNDCGRYQQRLAWDLVQVRTRQD